MQVMECRNGDILYVANQLILKIIDISAGEVTFGIDSIERVYPKELVKRFYLTFLSDVQTELIENILINGVSVSKMARSLCMSLEECQDRYLDALRTLRDFIEAHSGPAFKAEILADGTAIVTQCE